jgi:hypothetical protein
MATHRSKTTTNHSEIRKWAESRGAKPACVKGTGSGDDPGMIRLDFPGYSGSDSLQEISWDDWFRAFDDNDLALVYEDTTSGGEQSNFNKLVGRDTAKRRAAGDSKASRHHGSGSTRSKSSRSSSRTASGRSSGRSSSSSHKTAAHGKSASKSSRSHSRSASKRSRS